jgi:hypothetical protein
MVGVLLVHLLVVLIKRPHNFSLLICSGAGNVVGAPLKEHVSTSSEESQATRRASRILPSSPEEKAMQLSSSLLKK